MQACTWRGQGPPILCDQKIFRFAMPHSFNLWCAPTIVPPFQGLPGSQLQSGSPATHTKHHLPLLPSGPGGVWCVNIVQDPAFNAACLFGTRNGAVRWWEFDPGIADSGSQGAANSPSSTPIHLHKIYWSRADSNRRPSRCEHDALPAELLPQHFSPQRQNSILPFSSTALINIKLGQNQAVLEDKLGTGRKSAIERSARCLPTHFKVTKPESSVAAPGLWRQSSSRH